MRTFHPLPFLTLAFAYFATAHCGHDSRLQRRDVIAMDHVNIFDRDLSTVLPRSNASDAYYSLEMNHKRALDDDFRLMRRVTSGTVQLSYGGGLFVGQVSFDGQVIDRVAFDTGSSVAWARFPSSTNDRGAQTFTALSRYNLQGQLSRATSTVIVARFLTSKMQFLKVGGQDSDSSGYRGGLGLGRSHISWPKLNVNRIPAVFAFLSAGKHIEFDFGMIEPKYERSIEWHYVGSGDTWTPIDRANFKVHGEEVQGAGFSTILNTGVPFIYGHPHDVGSVYQKLPKSKLMQHPEHNLHFWMTPCDERPQVTISWGGRDFVIENFLTKIDSTTINGIQYCRGAIRSRPGITNAFWLGARFFYNKYSAFDDTLGKVGFMTLRS